MPTDLSGTCLGFVYDLFSRGNAVCCAQSSNGNRFGGPIGHVGDVLTGRWICLGIVLDLSGNCLAPELRFLRSDSCRLLELQEGIC